MRYLIVPVILLTVACAPQKPKPATIVMDGTENKQFENLMFCGDVKKFVVATGEVSSKLVKAWDKIVGEQSEEKCDIRIKVDRAGNIVGHEILACEKPEVVPAVLKEASPVPVPTDPCLFESVSSIQYGINGPKEKKS